MLDKLINRYLSRKFFIFMIATILLILKIIDQNIWLIITTAYMGAEGIIDLTRVMINKN
ncbi:MAG: hypothetical protein ACO2OX_04560 [Candidatus Nanopusillus sp.]